MVLVDLSRKLIVGDRSLKRVREVGDEKFPVAMKMKSIHLEAFVLNDFLQFAAVC
jgi:hypothetical protein